MPLDLASRATTPALPGDPALLSMPPGPPPAFASQLYASIESDDAMTIASNALRVLRAEPAQVLLHFSGCLLESSMLTVELTAFAVPSEGTASAQHWVNIYKSMLGQVICSRDDSRRIVIPTAGGKPQTPTRAPYLLAPILLDQVGYFETELLHRTPFVPAWSPSPSPLVAEPERGGLVLKADGARVGRMNWWLASWQPFRLSGAPAGTACSTYVDVVLAERYAAALASPLRYACALAVRRREKEYGVWTKQTTYFFTV